MNNVQHDQAPIERDIMDTDRAIKQILWAYRHTEPNLCVHVTPKDVEALDQCLNYLEAEAKVRMVKTPGGWTIVMTDKDGNAIVPVENNEADLDKSIAANRRRAVQESVGALASRVKNAALTGEFSSSEVAELADAALLLAK